MKHENKKETIQECTNCNSLQKGFTHAEVPEAGQCTGFWSKGFTLAELLITLAIIGIVAVLTIPTLVANYQERSWNTASQVFERKLEEALKVMNVQGTLAGYTTTEAFVIELSKHIKITRICENDDITSCFADTVTWGDEEVDMSKIKKAKNFGQENWNTNTVGVQFANGTNGIIAYDPNCKQNPFSNEVTGTDCLAILYDADGFKNPNTQQQDLRGVNVLSLGSNCAMELSDGTCFTAMFWPTALSSTECEALKGELGINECRKSRDYWAGAVKTCHDMGSSLPSQEQLGQLAKDLYPNTTIYTNGAASWGDRDDDKAVELGLISRPTSNYFGLWANKEENGQYACARYFGSTYTSWGCGTDRSFDSFRNRRYAVCVAE